MFSCFPFGLAENISHICKAKADPELRFLNRVIENSFSALWVEGIGQHQLGKLLISPVCLFPAVGDLSLGQQRIPSVAVPAI